MAKTNGRIGKTWREKWGVRGGRRKRVRWREGKRGIERKEYEKDATRCKWGYEGAARHSGWREETEMERDERERERER